MGNLNMLDDSQSSKATRFTKVEGNVVVYNVPSEEPSRCLCHYDFTPGGRFVCGSSFLPNELQKFNPHHPITIHSSLHHSAICVVTDRSIEFRSTKNLACLQRMKLPFSLEASSQYMSDDAVTHNEVQHKERSKVRNQRAQFQKKLLTYN